MLELAGQSIPTDMQGESFAAVLADREKRIRNEVFAVRNWHGGNAHERAVRTTQYLYKENQHPLYGDCLKGGFGSSPSTQVLREAYLRGELNGAMSECFAQQRPTVELFEVSANGIAWRNLAQEPEYAAVRDDLAKKLQAMRSATGDFDYMPYEKPKK
jgi:N-sulfoglucosamine sulfohydrolase